MNTKESKTTTKYYNIISGPNKDALFDACKYAYDKHAKLSIDFRVTIGFVKNGPNCVRVLMPIVDIRIVGISHEDGSGESFNLHGYCRTDPNYLEGKNVCFKSYKFEAYYNTKSRKGYISFIE